MKAASKSTSSKVSALPTRPGLNGYSAKQIERIFNEISCSAAALRDFAQREVAIGENGDAAADLMICSMISERIGLLSDMAGGPGGTIGDAAAWLLGQKFAEEGASHG